jgi:hypothetical protein
MGLRRVTLEELSPENKRRVWEWLKKNKPAYVDMIKNDAIYKSIVKTFNCTQEVDVDANILLRPGQT